MSVSAIGGALPSLPSLPSVPGAESGGTAGAQGAGGSGFGGEILGALNNLEEMHAQADQLAAQAATGTLQDVHDYSIVATQAALTTELTVAVRNKAVEAFNEIMRMGV